MMMHFSYAGYNCMAFAKTKTTRKKLTRNDKKMKRCRGKSIYLSKANIDCQMDAGKHWGEQNEPAPHR
jgi:hypothetical protein